MKSDYKILTGLTILLTIGFLGAEYLLNHLPNGLQAIGQLISLVFGFWVAFVFIVKFVYRMSGITENIWDELPKRLTHLQAETLGNYWLAALVVSELTTVSVVFLFDREDWLRVFLFSGIFVLVMVLGWLNSKKKFMGHTKEEMFK
jgi:fucose 4-O-acetylase-like acetyltransferase